MALPSLKETSGAPNLEDIVPYECLSFLSDNHERMKRAPAEREQLDNLEPIDAYVDPVLRRNHRA